MAQLILETYSSASIRETSSIDATERGSNGFGSSDTASHTPIPSISSQANDSPHVIPPDDSTIIHVAKSPSPNDAHTAPVPHHIKACDIEMDWNQPIFTTTITIRNTGKHPTRGLELKPDKFGVLIHTCLRGTPAAKITNWRRDMKNALIHSIDGTIVKTTHDVIKAFAASKSSEVTLKVIPPEPTNVHEDTGLPQLNFDQFIGVTSQHQDILHGNFQFIVDNEMDNFERVQITKLVKKTLNRTQLVKRPNWAKWEQSEFLQLDQYDRQNMFGKPGPIPSSIQDPNILPMIWVYIIKVDGRYKARCVANGAPHLKGSITLAQTYAACLEQSGCRIFWSLCAAKNKIIYVLNLLSTFYMSIQL